MKKKVRDLKPGDKVLDASDHWSVVEDICAGLIEGSVIIGWVPDPIRPGWADYSIIDDPNELVYVQGKDEVPNAG